MTRKREEERDETGNVVSKIEQEGNEELSGYVVFNLIVFALVIVFVAILLIVILVSTIR